MSSVNEAARSPFENRNIAYNISAVSMYRKKYWSVHRAVLAVLKM